MVQVILAARAMGQPPVAAKYFYGALVCVHDRVDAERRGNERSHALALFVYGVSVEESGSYAGFATAAFEIAGEHVCGFDRLCGSEAGTDRFATPGKSGEVMKRDPAGQKHARELFQRAVDFSRGAALRLPEARKVRTIVWIVLQDAQSLGDERCQ